MIERYVFIKLNEKDATSEGRADVVERSRALSQIPGVRTLCVGVPADDGSATAWDVALTLRFDDLAAVEAYRLHPDHRAYVDDFLAPRMAVIKAWNFEV